MFYFSSDQLLSGINQAIIVYPLFGNNQSLATDFATRFPGCYQYIAWVSPEIKTEERKSQGKVSRSPGQYS